MWPQTGRADRGACSKTVHYHGVPFSGRFPAIAEIGSVELAAATR
jgi:hypothetical protein